MARRIFLINRYPIPVVLVALHTALMIWNERSTGTIKDQDPSVGTNLLFLCNFADTPTLLLWVSLPNPVFALFPGLSFIWIFGTIQWLAIGVFMQLIINRGRATPRGKSPPRRDWQGPGATDFWRDIEGLDPSVEERVRLQPEQGLPDDQAAIRPRKSAK